MGAVRNLRILSSPPFVRGTEEPTDSSEVTEISSDCARRQKHIPQSTPRRTEKGRGPAERGQTLCPMLGRIAVPSQCLLTTKDPQGFLYVRDFRLHCVSGSSGRPLKGKARAPPAWCVVEAPPAQTETPLLRMAPRHGSHCGLVRSFRSAHSPQEAFPSTR